MSHLEYSYIKREGHKFYNILIFS